MLTYILDGGASARLATNLIRGSQLAVSIDTSYNAFSRLPGMLILDAVPRSGVSLEKVESAIQKEIDRFKTERVAEEEMARVRNQIIASKVFEKDSVFYQAMQIGQLETVGLDWRLADDYVDHLNAVTAEQVKQVAEKYLVDDNLTVAVLHPLPLQESVVKQAVVGGHYAR
jgi:zinc protease